MKYRIAPADFFQWVVSPALIQLAPDAPSLAARQLVLGTAMVESALATILQVKGPALGFWQMEPATHDDIWENFISHRPWLRTQLYDHFDGASNSAALLYNQRYAAAMCRIHFMRVQEPLPVAGDFTNMARYWKQYYNTPKGKGTIAKALQHFRDACVALA